MPLVTISILKGKSPAYVKAVADGVNAAVIETMGFPADDRYQVIHELAPECLELQARQGDRVRVLSHIADRNEPEIEEMTTLLRRSRWVHWAISLSTLAALLVCVVIAALFVGSEFGINPSRVVSLLFIMAMLVLIAGLLCFLREISLSTGTIEKPEQ